MVLIHPPREESDRLYDSRDLDYSHAYSQIVRKARAASFGGYGSNSGDGSSLFFDNGASSSSSFSSASAAVLLLVSPDPDALCAARALARLLHEDDVPYRIVPVDGYTKLQNIIEDDVVGNDELHTLIFLNLGSVLSLSTYFIPPKASRNQHGGSSQDDDDDDEEEPTGFPLPSKCTVHVLDSHRPWNLDNLFATSEMMERVYIWDDGEVKERLANEAEAYAKLEFDWGMESDEDSDEDSEDDDDDESDEEDGDRSSETDSEGGRRPKRRRARADGEGDGDSNASSPKKRRRKRKDREERPKKMTPYERERLEGVLTKYYHRGTTMGLAVSGMAYLLAVKLGRSDNEALWLGILGLTSQYTSNQIPADMYEEQSQALASDVVAMNPVTNNEHPSIGFNPDDSSIRVLKHELRFTLFRHWSLEDSMYHTAYVAAKLNIWKEAGMGRLRGLLAKMGFSLANCRQTYEHMDLDLRKSLVTRMESIAPEYGLTELVFRSFIRSYGFKSAPFSAADAVEGISALLQAAYDVRLEVDTPGMTFAAACANGVGGQEMRYNAVPGALHASELFGGRRVWNLGDPGSAPEAQRHDGGKENRPVANKAPLERQKQGEAVDEVAPRNEDTWVRNFFAAYNALDSSKIDSIHLLQASLSLSKALHRRVLVTGISLIEKEAIRSLRSFRLAVLKDGPDLALFTHPAMLTRLAIWLIDALRDSIVELETVRNSNKRQRKNKRKNGKQAAAAGEEENPSSSKEIDAPISLPFVVAALDRHANRYLVVGVSGATDFGDVRRNKFGLAFQDAAQKSGATTQHDRFETTVIEVSAAHLSGFVEALHVRA